MPDFTPTTWAAALLKTLGIHQTPAAVQSLAGWAKAEGGHWNNDARYNPLNTTQPEPGAGNTGTQGNIKVYRDWQQGLQATAETLRNGRYGGILSALAAGDPRAVASAIDKSPWGTHGALVYNAIMGTPRVAGVHAPSAPGVPSAPSPGARTTTTTTRTTPGVDNSAARAAAIQQFLGTKGADPLDFALQVRGLQDTPGKTTTSAATYKGPSGSPSTAPASTTPGEMPTGTAKFEGKTVAAWIAPVLAYARRQGWKGQVNSGFRSFAEQTRIYNSGVRPAAKPGTSNHEGADFPRGAVDVSDADQLSAIIAKSKYARLLQWAGAKDPVHFSHPHGGSY